MKKITYLLIALVIFSCSSDDDGNPTNPVEETYNYFPLTSGTYWTFDNESDQGTTRDSLYVSGVEEINGITHTVLGAEQPTTGFMTVLLSQSLVRATETTFLLNGELGAPPIDGFPELSIPLVDFIMYDVDAIVGDELSETSGEIEQTVQDIPLVITFTVKTVQGETFENGYGGFSESVTSSELIVNLSISAVIDFNGFPITIPILQAQNVVTVTNYYADGIGLIDSDTLIEYELEDLSDFGIDLPFPESDSRNATQIIDTYHIED